MDRTVAVLLTLLALRFTFFFVRGHFIMIHLAKTLQHVMVHKLQDYAPSSTMVYWIVWPQIVAAAIVMPMFITFLPNAAGVATTAPEQLEMYLRATWICFIVIVTVHGVSIIPITWTVHTTVSNSIAAFANSQGGSDELSLKKRMRTLDVRMRHNAIRIGISTINNLAFCLAAVVIGMKYWYVCPYTRFLTGPV